MAPVQAPVVFVLAACCQVALVSHARGQASVAQVAGHQEISMQEGGFGGVLGPGARFGMAVASLGDLDGDGVDDIAVGSPYTQYPSTPGGTVWILFLQADGTVKAQQEITQDVGGFTGPLAASDQFGTSLANLGDLDRDGVVDLAVGAPTDSVWSAWYGAIWILFLNTDGTVKAQQKINNVEGGIAPAVVGGEFGTSMAPLGDLDGDGVPDLAVGGPRSKKAPLGFFGAVWILLLRPDGTVSGLRRITYLESGFSWPLDDDDRFGQSVASLGDFDGDGVTDLVVGAIRDDDGQSGAGAVYLLFLKPNSTVKADAKISHTEGGFSGLPGLVGNFGTSVACPGDLDGDGVSDLVVGEKGTVDGLGGVGAVWALLLNGNGSVKDELRIVPTGPGLGMTVQHGEHFGSSIACLGDLDADGEPDLVVGASRRYDDLLGAVHILFIDSGPWFDLSLGLAGTGGLVPRLSGDGPVLPNQLISMTLADALPDSTAWLVAGIATLHQPFKGGTLVPDPAPPGVILPVPTGPAGGVSLQGLWPDGVPPGFSAFLQFWVADPGGPAGWAASNAIQGTTP